MMKLANILVTFLLFCSSFQLLALNGDLGKTTEPLTDGSEQYPYLIEDIDDFNTFASSPDCWNIGVYTKLMSDLDLIPNGSYTTSPIGGTSNTSGMIYNGNFNGNSKIISQLKITSTHDEIGLFYRIGPDAIIANFSLENVTIHGTNSIGGLTSSNYGTILNCNVAGEISGTYIDHFSNPSFCIGGLCGRNLGIVSCCSSSCILSSGATIGGLCGNNSGLIEESFSTGTVYGMSSVGGICGENYILRSGGQIQNCYVTGVVSSSTHIGGIGDIGGICGDNGNGSILDCYSLGFVTGDTPSGGICGITDEVEGTVTNVYFFSLYAPDNNIGTALNHIEMSDAVNYSGFDFSGNSEDGAADDWVMVENFCPKLAWQSDDGPLTPMPPETTLSGSGYYDDPFQINNLNDFDEFHTNNQLVYGYYSLNTDLNLENETFSTAVINRNFGGHFSGNGNRIFNLNIDAYDSDNCGLFNMILTEAQISNLGLEFVNISANDYTGALCSTNRGLIYNCYVRGTVKGRCGVGILCGLNDGGTIENCYTIGNIVGKPGGYMIGGFCGSISGMISNCYTIGSINTTNSTYSIGGFCGCISNGIVSNSFSSYSVIGFNEFSPFCGNVNNGNITNSFWDVDKYGMGYEGKDNLGAIGKLTASMHSESTYVDSGWSFYSQNGNSADWFMPTDNFPKLNWEPSLCYSGSNSLTLKLNEQDDLIINLFTMKEDINWDLSGYESCLWITNISPVSGSSSGPDDLTQIVISIDTNNIDFGHYICDLIATLDNGEFIHIPINLSLNKLEGDGTEQYPYIIHDFSDFKTFSDPENASLYYQTGTHVMLDCDLDLNPELSGREVYSGAVIPVFSGVFNGNGHTISNLKIDVEEVYTNYIGLFGTLLGGDACIDLLTLENINITTSLCYKVGGICGQNSEGNIRYCKVSGTLSDANEIGGICGFNDDGHITRCESSASITGGQKVGGICGNLNKGSITYCSSSCIISAHIRSAGGICGYLNREGIINNCYATGTMTGQNRIGGICGIKQGEIPIYNCYSTCEITGDTDIGGICGTCSTDLELSSCIFYNLAALDNQRGIALDRNEMLNQSSYIGFDFAGNSEDGNEDCWVIVEGHTPKFTWQSGDGPSLPPLPETTLIGSGTVEEPYQINNYEDFLEFRNNGDLKFGHYILNTDIDLSGEIYDKAVISRYFAGYFDGNSHTIRNIYIETQGEDNSYLGLFRLVYRTVENLSIEDITIIGSVTSKEVGALCGYNHTGTISSCFASGTITIPDSELRYKVFSIGGLCGTNGSTIINSTTNIEINTGKNSSGIGGLVGRNFYVISNCHSSGHISGDESVGGLAGMDSFSIYDCNSSTTVSGKKDVGGFVGFSGGSSIERSSSSGTVTGSATSQYVGGFCGRNVGFISQCFSSGATYGDLYIGGFTGYNERNTISLCYSISPVEGIDSVGGFCGRNYDKGNINYCYSAGSVIGSRTSAGFCGYNWYNAKLTNCFWDIETSQKSTGYNGGNFDGNVINVLGKTTSEMQTLSTYLNLGWDFSPNDGDPENWKLLVNDYPHLAWEDLASLRFGQAEFALISQYWMNNSSNSPEYETVDFVNDNVINFSDLLWLSQHWLELK